MSIIVSTSGTSGISKKIELTDEIIQARINTITEAKGANISDCKVIHVGWVENSSSSVRFSEWAKQTNKKIIGIVPIDEIVEIFDRENVDCIFAAPGYLVAVAKQFEKVGKSANLLQIITGHRSIENKDVNYIKNWLTKNIQVNYGCTEIGTITSGTIDEISDIDGCVGFPISGVQIEIIGAVIRIKAPLTMVNEYIDNPQKTTENFIDGWFYPGDKGYFTKDGRLVITKNR
jgi:acyl-coenzyme A synthetase/AMP-(fatty) acid ligase